MGLEKKIFYKKNIVMFTKIMTNSVTKKIKNNFKIHQDNKLSFSKFFKVFSLFFNLGKFNKSFIIINNMNMLNFIFLNYVLCSSHKFSSLVKLYLSIIKYDKSTLVKSAGGFNKNALVLVNIGGNSRILLNFLNNFDGLVISDKKFYSTLNNNSYITIPNLYQNDHISYLFLYFLYKNY